MSGRISFYKVPEAFSEIEEVIEKSYDEETGAFNCDVSTITTREELRDRADEGVEWYAKQDKNLSAQEVAIIKQQQEIQNQINEMIEPYMKEYRALELVLKARGNRRDFNKSLVAALLQVLDADSLELSTGKKVWTQVTESVEASPDLDLDSLDPKLVKTKVTHSLDKAACKKAAKDGEWSVPGINIVKKHTIRFPE